MKALFAAALEVPASERLALLQREAGGDAALIAEVQSLLAAHDQPDGLLDSAPTDLRAQAFAATGDPGRVGERIGAYRVVGVLGTGGMGQVFSAVRDDDQYRAEVAIKLMRADFRDTFAEQRFRTERQILAGLDHRNIARLIDGGTTSGGSPYVVMELVKGEPIDQYSEAHGLKVRDRVQLFLQVCAAVSYAHQHLVVHRDLKPNNILVTADGSVKLLDFGIAKLLEANADTSIVEANATVTTLRAMTLDYASPEQVSGAPVSTASDVYSLGVVLYRLLTGRSPYAARNSDAARMAEILSDSTPTRPSQVEHKVDADLDNILLMALRKEPQRRYASVEQFANDLRNYLAGMPVSARGNSLRYRAGKFARRHRVEIVAGVLVGCALLGALVVSLREARIADYERQVAEQHFASVRKLANTMLFQLHDEMALVPGSIKTRALLVKTSLEYLDELYKASSSDRALQEELAVAYRKVGDIQGDESGANVGDYQGALRNYSRAVALLEPLDKADPASTRIAILLSTTYTQQAKLMLVAGSALDSQVPAQKAVAMSESLAATATDTERVVQLANAYDTYANTLFALSRPIDAMQVLEKLLALCDERWRADPQNEQVAMLLIDTYNDAANHADPRLPDAADLGRAIALLRRALRESETLVARVPANNTYQAALSRTRYNLARMLYANAEYPTALELYRLAAAAAATAARDPNDQGSQYRSALMNSGVAQALFAMGRVEEARTILMRCEEVLARLTQQGGTLRIMYARGHNHVRLGILYESLANSPGLSAHARLELWRKARGALQAGVGELQKVTAVVAIEPMDRAALTAGVAGLAQAEAVLAAHQDQTQ